MAELSDEIDNIRRKHLTIKNRLMLKEIDDYMRATLTDEQWEVFNNKDYHHLMHYMDKRIEEL